MIVDCHSHIWPSAECLGKALDFSCLNCPGESSPQASSGEHQASSGPADVSLVLGFVSNQLNCEIPNDFISSYVSAQPGSLIGFAGLDPMASDSSKDLDRIISNGIFAGITVSPACQNFHPFHSWACKIYEAAEANKMPVYFLYGTRTPTEAALSLAAPSGIDEVAREFPNLKIVISHLGFPWIEQTISLLAKHENVFADVAGLTNRPFQAYRSLTLAYEYDVIGKLLFGSDFPNHTVSEAVEFIYNLNKITRDSVLPAIPREQLRTIVERNSLELLGLKLNKVED